MSARDSSEAFEDWKFVDADIRSFVLLSEKWSAAAYAEALEDAKREFARTFDPDNDDPQEWFYDFHGRMRFVWEADYLWMLRAGALRDAVTAFEVYAERSTEEVLRRWRLPNGDGHPRRIALSTLRHQTSPTWQNLCRVHAALGSNLGTDGVKYVRDLRHLLAHQRGELRTEALRTKFTKETGPRRGGPFDSKDIPLEPNRVLEMLDDLALAAEACDTIVRQRLRDDNAPRALYVLATEKNAPVILV